jgi:hypothetical protein
LSRKSLTHAVAVLFALSVVMTGSLARADEFKLIPAMTLKEEFNDNIFFFSGTAQSSFISTLSAGLTLLDRTERLTAKMDARLDGLLYSATSDLNSIDQSYGALADYRLSPLFGVRGSAGFDRASRPDRLIETTGMVVVQTSSHQAYSVSGDLTLTEKLTGVLTYGYDAVYYDGPVVSDAKRHDLTTGLVYDLGRLVPLLKIQANLGFSTLRYATSTVDNSTATIGFSYQVHELWSMQAGIGGRFTHVDFDEPAIDASGVMSVVHRSNDSPGWVANVAAYYKGEVDSAALTLSRNVQTAAGRSGAVEATAVSAGFGRKFSSELSGFLGGGYYLNTSRQNEFASQSIDERTYRVNPTLRYEFSPDIALDLSYEFALVQDRQSGTEAERNKVFLCLIMQRPFFEHR